MKGVDEAEDGIRDTSVTGVQTCALPILKDKESLQSILDDVRGDLKKVRKLISAEDRRMLEDHEVLVRQMEKEIAESGRQKLRVSPPTLERSEERRVGKECR